MFLCIPTALLVLVVALVALSVALLAPVQAPLHRHQPLRISLLGLAPLAEQHLDGVVRALLVIRLRLVLALLTVSPVLRPLLHPPVDGLPDGAASEGRGGPSERSHDDLRVHHVVSSPSSNPDVIREAP